MHLYIYIYILMKDDIKNIIRTGVWRDKSDGIEIVREQ